ncbi:MAG: hypothetical protein CMF38_03270 [Legionellaceae bacterium]|nr:hypothetical protein [Legionellaceae bacterium]HAF87669.1 hypothetical protein [Legionellales bacterium]HCA89820.1 hypothetical protein [Legionellales bacterium]|tara:strand:+ start:872 stop:3295 length:2424 start_codon:yes stop_codon:yes gene_type:complete
MKLKKIPYYVLLASSVIGATVVLAFLSFAGMLALSHLLILGLFVSALTIYESEIYYQNIKGALNKLFFKSNYLKHRLSEEFLCDFYKNYPLTLEFTTKEAFDELENIDPYKIYMYGAEEAGEPKLRYAQSNTGAKKPQTFSGLSPIEKSALADYLVKPADERQSLPLDFQETIKSCLPEKYRAKITLDQSKVPQFFIDYAAELSRLAPFEHHHLSKESQAQKAQIEKRIKHMERFFVRQLFNDEAHCLQLVTQAEKPSNPDRGRVYLYVEQEEKLAITFINHKGRQDKVFDEKACENSAAIIAKIQNNKALDASERRQIMRFCQRFNVQLHHSTYKTELQDWLRQHGQQELISRFKSRRLLFHKVKLFSLFSGFFTGLSTSYLLLSEFAAIPFLAAIPLSFLPFIIVPLAVVAGLSYTLLIYNAVTDMINNRTLQTWWQKLKNDFKQGLNWRNSLMALASIALIALAIALTLCTAGTWWTVAKHSAPIFDWMRRIPSVVMGVINPLATGLAALIFNVQNTYETFTILNEAMQQKGFFLSRMWQQTKTSFNNLRAQETTWQLLNPFRLLLKVTFMPLRIVLFLGHLISIGVTADRVPGIPAIASALLGIISEGFEDLHYFVGHEHEHAHHHHTAAKAAHHHLKAHLTAHGHDHSDDIPTKILKYLFYPLFGLAALWDWGASKNLSLEKAWYRQTGQQAPQKVPAPTQVASVSWQKTYALNIIHPALSKLTSQKKLNSDEQNMLETFEDLEQTLQAVKDEDKDGLEQALKSAMPSLQVPHKHHFWSGSTKATQKACHKLQKMVAPAMAG